MLKSENTNYTYILQGGGARLSAFGGYFSLLDRLKPLLCRHSEGEARVPEARHYNESWIISGSLCKDDENVIASEAKQSRRKDRATECAMTEFGTFCQPHVIAEGEVCPRSLWIASSQAPRNDSNGHSESRARRISLNKRFFGFHPRNDIAKKAAFTLAEVLITLGIIGIVAAMTLPTLIASYNKQECSVRLKKFYSTMSNALNLATIDYGAMRYWEFPTTQNNGPQMAKFAKTYLFPYLTGLRECGDENEGASECFKYGSKIFNQGLPAVYIFSDGSCFGMNIGGSNESAGNIHIYYDYNCMKRPNEYGKDVFDFIIRWYKYYDQYTFKAGGYGVHDKTTREEFLNYCKNATGNGRGECAGLIQYDGWEIKDDYPWW